MNEGDKRLDDMSEDERWHAFREVLVCLAMDGVIDTGEEELICALSKLYRLEKFKSLPWDDLASQQEDTTKRKDYLVSLAELVISRILERDDPDNFTTVTNALAYVANVVLDKNHTQKLNEIFIKRKSNDSLSSVGNQIVTSFKLWKQSQKTLAALPELSQPLPNHIAAKAYGTVSDSNETLLEASVPEIPALQTWELSDQDRVSLENALGASPDFRILNEVEDGPISFFARNAAFANEGENQLIWFLTNSQHEVWFAGDVHGDRLAFESICLAFEAQSSPDAKLIFLGDLIDRGHHDEKVVLRLWQKMKESPNRYGWIVGNHDIGLQFTGENFTSSVIPAEFAVRLNEKEDIRTLGKTFISICEVAPRAIFFDGLLAAHGGFPLKDRWDQIQTRADLSRPENLTEFVWNRLSCKRFCHPNRNSHTSCFGAEDFLNFRKMAKDKLGLEIDGMVRGHDHMNDQQARMGRPVEVPRSSFEGRVLTINSMSFNLEGEVNPFVPENPRFPTLAKWRSGTGLPTPVEIKLPIDLVENYACPCPTCSRPRAYRDAKCGWCGPDETTIRD